MDKIIEKVAPNSFVGIVEKLRTEAAHKPVFAAVAQMLSTRQRARGRVTLGALITTMTKTDHNFTREEYKSALSFLSRVGIGQLDYDIHGKMRSLKSIRFTLQSIGEAALGRTEKLEMFGVRPYVTADGKSAPKAPVAAPKKLDEVLKEKTVEMVLRVNIDGTHMDFALPRKITPQEFSSFLKKVWEIN